MEVVNKNMVTEITICYQPSQEALKREKIICVADAYKQILKGFDENTIMVQEQCVVMYLNYANDVIGLYKASKGGITGTVVDIRLILSIGLKTLSTKIIIAHNHPSGNLVPSRQDVDITDKLKQAGKFMDIVLVDHLIITSSGRYYSFAEEGYI
jgi:DNA repair protein RadC